MAESLFHFFGKRLECWPDSRLLVEQLVWGELVGSHRDHNLRDERQKKNGLIYTTTSADGRALALLSLSGSSKGEATLCWRLSVQKNPKRRRGAFPGVQHMGGVVDKGCG